MIRLRSLEKNHPFMASRQRCRRYRKIGLGLQSLLNTTSKQMFVSANSGLRHDGGSPVSSISSFTKLLQVRGGLSKTPVQHAIRRAVCKFLHVDNDSA